MKGTWINGRLEFGRCEKCGESDPAIKLYAWLSRVLYYEPTVEVCYIGSHGEKDGSTHFHIECMRCGHKWWGEA